VQTVAETASDSHPTRSQPPTAARIDRRLGVSAIAG